MSDDPKQLKLGWTISKTIGVAVVNPRAASAMRKSLGIVLSYKGSTLTLQKDSIKIEGSIEEAAMALAEHILEDKKNNPDIKYFSYISIEAYLIEDEVFLNPKIKAQHYDMAQWDLLKQETEKICNKLTAFM